MTNESCELSLIKRRHGSRKYGAVIAVVCDCTNMPLVRFSITPRLAASLVIAALLASAPLAIAGPPSPGSIPKPSSYAPHHSTSHVYGDPIDPPVVHRGKWRHHVQAPKKTSSAPSLSSLNMTPHVTAK